MFLKIYCVFWVILDGIIISSNVTDSCKFSGILHAHTVLLFYFIFAFGLVIKVKILENEVENDLI